MSISETRALPIEGLFRYKVTRSEMLYTLMFTIDDSSLPLPLTISVLADFYRFASVVTPK
jgi:hypothetical protein